MAPSPEAPLTELTRRLLDDVRRKSGIRHDRPVERKLARLLSSHPAEERESWVREIETSTADSPVWLALIESLTVHETYFFRDIPHHAHLRAQVLPALIRARRNDGSRTLRLWSAGCATGEEAYSLAIVALEALADMGEADRTPQAITTVWRLEVLGTDISRAAVLHARDGLYGGAGLGPFRDVPPDYLAWFVPDPTPGHRRVRPDGRGPVRFARHNLIDPTPPETGFDLVSCRNVLIYFDDEARAMAQRTLMAGLAPGGFLVLGTTDHPLDGVPLERLRGERAIAYRLPAGSGAP